MPGLQGLPGLLALAAGLGLRLAVEALRLVLAGDGEASLPKPVGTLADRALAAGPLPLRHFLLPFFLHQFARLDPQCFSHLADSRKASWSIACLQVADRRLGYAGHSAQVLLAYSALHSQLP